MAKVSNAVKSNGSKVQTPTPNGALSKALLVEGKRLWSEWLKSQRWIALGIREKTATKTGTRAAMLCVAANGYAQGQGKVLAQAVLAAKGLNPNVGGIDFPWLEKAANMATITSSSAVRLDAKDGKMRLLPIVPGKAKPKKSAEVEAVKVRKAGATPRKGTDRANGPVTTSRMSDAELAELQAAADITAAS